ncbi:unnamed protein product [Trifolium pratense]|uniref:Uncharacterized protein n=1 Tax=Trifolium pratense TaxID=57577 RepID=A0ACB0KWI0_TRIPR|nr:unnamed protein product [Trifolium pratense]
MIIHIVGLTRAQEAAEEGLTNTAATHLSPIWSHNCDVACVGGGAIDWVGVATPPLTSAVHVWLFRSTHWAASHLLSSIDISSDGVGRIGTHKQVYFLFGDKY